MPLLIGACADDDAGSSDGATDGSTGALSGGTLGDGSMSASGSTSGGSSSTSSGDGSGSTSGATTAGSTSTGSDEPPLVCNPADSDEPNNSENAALPLPNITDEDGAGDWIESILAGEKDEDWYTYKGTDVAFAYVDPTGELYADMKLRLCVFVECIGGATQEPDCNNSLDATSPGGRMGCCSTGEDAFVMIDLYCDSGGDDNANVYMRIDRGYADQCVPYEVFYHY